MSNKPRANQISLTSTGFSKNLSINDNDLQKAFNTIDQLTVSAGTSSHNLLLGIQGGSVSDGYYHFTNSQHTWLLDGYNTGKWSALKGGTGLSFYAAGDIIYASSANTLSVLNKSTDGYYLKLSGGLPSWAEIAATGSTAHNSLTGLQGGKSGSSEYYHLGQDSYTWLNDSFNLGYWSALKGGTGLTSYASGDILYSNATNTLTKLPKSTDGYYLQLVSGLPDWKSISNESIVLGRDLSGTTNDAYVKGFNGIGLTDNTPNDGYVYAYNSFLNKWTPSQINNNTNSVVIVGKQGLLKANSTTYLLPNFFESTDESSVALIAPISGTLSNLIIYCNTAPGGSETVVITIRKNGIDTAITATLTGASLSSSDTTHLINISSGDKITVKSVVSANSVASDLFVSLIFTTPITNAIVPSFGFYIVPIDIIFSTGQTVNASTNILRVSSRVVDLSQYPVITESKIRTIKFVAVLEAQGSVGTTANIELYDVTNSSTVTGSTLSTILNTPTHVTSAALTLGSSLGNLRTDASTLYDVRLTMTNGNLSTDAAICCYSALIITYV